MNESSTSTTNNFEKRTKLRDVQKPQENTPEIIEETILEPRTVKFTVIRKISKIPQLEPIVEQTPY